MSVKPILEITADGSHTLFVPALNEHYHSTNGAVQESMHVFIQAGLQQTTQEVIHILEIGFGTGLNAFLTLNEVFYSSKRIHYTSLEAYPLSIDIVRQLNYPKQFAADHTELYYKLHTSRWEDEMEICPNFYIRKLNADFTQFDFNNLTAPADLIYFDAFAPDKQGEMWTQDLFDKLFHAANQGAILVTYCAKGVVRRMMQQSGFRVERLSGPPGKREMLRATKPML